MRKRSLFLAGLAAVGLSVALNGSQHESTERVIRLRFPNGADLSGLSIQYFLVGPFGGFGSFVRTSPDVREYSVDTWRGGQQASTLKAIIYCRGYRPVLLTESALAERRVGTVSIGLEPMGWLPLSGRLIAVPAPTDLKIEAAYLAYWAHKFFGITDGEVPSFTVDTTKVAADGSFALRVPDFAHDPVATSFGDGLWRGEIRLVAREMGSGNIPYQLEEVQQAGQPVRLSIAAEYPRDLLLVGIPR
jgi:hypothetical protein